MQRALTLYRTSIGKKAVMALSGVVLVGFVIGHLAGNLNAYAGPRAFNEYANGLRDIPALLWGIRILLLAAVLAHIVSGLSLIVQNRGARPARYAMKKDIATTYAARMMPLTGITLLAYILFHLGHLTFGLLPGFDVTNPYNNLVLGFQNPWLSAFYIVGNLSLGVHLYHGVWSMFQSVGANHPRYNHYRTDLAVAIATFVTMGFLSFPIMVMAGVLEPTSEVFNLPNLR
jgi:succinate dehydrogenase / fumarate reductase, cytochrome b subunit